MNTNKKNESLYGSRVFLINPLRNEYGLGTVVEQGPSESLVEGEYRIAINGHVRSYERCEFEVAEDDHPSWLAEMTLNVAAALIAVLTATGAAAIGLHFAPKPLAAAKWWEAAVFVAETALLALVLRRVMRR
jgi:hypothetical protein